MNPNDPNVVMMELVAERLGAGLPGDAASQARLPDLEDKLRLLANLN